ncbi:hypothetical protein THICB1_180046 [Thiomonas arsenitoxydans]|uniref:Uncharacterized protein n=1 Tax=Thiomonas arsenitoxydans (strain DSM 22701 / CIP 110005 / 3As) TaxID=426114 RepID=A0ABP1Z3R7_THIA3|nr:hypothetical protein THICB1_180046 [Thiomonas arsenitoxydans]CQR36814.1 hypothetical protein THICB6_280036 [Thiomonas arsenitoxydans]
MTWGTDAGQPDCTGGLQELRMTWFRHHALTELIVPSHDGSRDLRPQWCSRTDADWRQHQAIRWRFCGA